jgi:hypothetical protein
VGPVLALSFLAGAPQPASATLMSPDSAPPPGTVFVANATTNAIPTWTWDTYTYG